MSKAIADYLKNKDEDYSQYIPSSYKMTEDEKRKELFLRGLTDAYHMTRAASCMKPCFKTLDSPVVS
jgi:hypothetical protein